MFTATFETQSVLTYWVGYEWAHSLLSLGFTAQWNPKHPLYVSTRLFCNSILQLCCGEQTMRCLKRLTSEKK